MRDVGGWDGMGWEGYGSFVNQASWVDYSVILCYRYRGEGFIMSRVEGIWVGMGVICIMVLGLELGLGLGVFVECYVSGLG